MSNAEADISDNSGAVKTVPMECETPPSGTHNWSDVDEH